jgi:arylsulfatase A-like enzyme
VLFIVADDHRAGAIGSLGTPAVQTPTFDALATRGVAFTNTHLMGGRAPAVCVPGRAGLYTGANTFRAIPDPTWRTRLNPELALLPETFRRAGYRTHHVGKWHNGTEAFMRCFESARAIYCLAGQRTTRPDGLADHWHLWVHDFDPTGEYPREAQYVTPGEPHSSELFADRAIDFLREYPDDLDDGDRSPFFLSLATYAPHDPRTAPPEYHALYDPNDVALPPNALPQHPFDNGHLDVRDELLAPFPRTPDVIRRHLADYYAMITHLDAQLGRVLRALAERRDAENTIVVYTADHGLAVGQHGLLGKQNMYQHTVRIPLLMAGPGLPSGTRVDALTYNQDVFPTLCALAGVPIPDTVEGHSLLPLIDGTTERLYDTVYAVYRNVQRMVSDGQWKLIRYYRSVDDITGAVVGTDRVQLFHLTEDPWELCDLSPYLDQPERLARLAGQLADWQQRVEDPLLERPPLPVPV